MSVAVLILILCVLLAVWSWMRPRHPSPPMYPGALPFIGHAHLLIGDFIHLWKFFKGVTDYSLEKGGVVHFRIGLHSAYMLTDPDDSLVVANTCLDKPYIYDFAKEAYNNGLITADACSWKIHRKLLNPAFNQQLLNTYMYEYNVQARNLVSQLASKVGKEPFDVQRDMVKFGLKTITGTSLGLKAQDQHIIDNDYAQTSLNLLAVFAERIKKVWLHPTFLYNRSSLKCKEDKFVKINKDIIIAVIDKRKKELKANNKLKNVIDSTPDKFNPLLDQLLNLAEKQDAFTDKEILDHLDTFVAAAFNSTASTLTYTLLLIGSNQDVQARIYDEVQNVLGDQDRDLNKEDLPKLVYLEAVIKETLRLYPPGPFIARKANTDVTLENYTLPAGSTCFISLNGINRHSMWGADAEQFRPERWLDPSTLPDTSNAFASFSLGRRNCIGKLYAIMAIKTALAHLLRRYQVTGDISNLESQWEITLTPVAGNLISLTLRT